MPLPLMLGGTLALRRASCSLVVRWALRRLEHALEQRGGLSQDIVAIVVFLVLASAWTTERLGIHALFGAFLAGAVMPRGRAASSRPLLDRLEDLMVILFLPALLRLHRPAHQHRADRRGELLGLLRAHHRGRGAGQVRRLARSRRAPPACRGGRRGPSAS